MLSKSNNWTVIANGMQWVASQTAAGFKQLNMQVPVSAIIHTQRLDATPNV